MDNRSNQQMMTIGITGGIGAGKSYVCHLLNIMNFPIFSADEEGKKLVANNELLRQEIIQLLGPEAYTEEGYNRKWVAEQIFGNEKLKKKLEEIIHPAVASEFERWTEEQSQFNFAFLESAILFESGFNEKVDKVIMVYADEDVRIQRTIQRDQCTREEAVARIQAQLSDEIKRNQADYVIYNNLDDDLNKQLFKLVKELYRVSSSL